MRENAVAKGRRYIAEGRLIVRELDTRAGTVRATCRGAGAVYELGRDHRGKWWCTCPAYTTCAHLAALQLCVAFGRREAGR